jgi:hypothetical protein
MKAKRAEEAATDDLKSTTFGLSYPTASLEGIMDAEVGGKDRLAGTQDGSRQSTFFALVNTQTSTSTSGNTRATTNNQCSTKGSIGTTRTPTINNARAAHEHIGADKPDSTNIELALIGTCSKRLANVTLPPPTAESSKALSNVISNTEGVVSSALTAMASMATNGAADSPTTNTTVVFTTPPVSVGMAKQATELVSLKDQLDKFHGRINGL